MPRVTDIHVEITRTIALPGYENVKVGLGMSIELGPKDDAETIKDAAIKKLERWIKEEEKKYVKKK